MAKTTTRRKSATKAPVKLHDAPLHADHLSTGVLDITTRDDEGRTPLHLAAWYGYSTTVRRMISQQAEVDARDEKQRTPGHWAAFKGYLDIVKMLVESGSDVNARDENGRTLLAMAIIGKQTAMEAYLRSHQGIS